jgi:hypothetical protein
MAPKTWDRLTDPEKIEDLRRDMLKIYDVFNSLAADVQRTWNAVQQTNAKLTEVSKAMAGLEARLPKATPNRP